MVHVENGPSMWLSESYWRFCYRVRNVLVRHFSGGAGDLDSMGITWRFGKVVFKITTKSHLPPRPAIFRSKGRLYMQFRASYGANMRVDMRGDQYLEDQYQRRWSFPINSNKHVNILQFYPVEYTTLTIYIMPRTQGYNLKVMLTKRLEQSKQGQTHLRRKPPYVSYLC